MIISLVMPVAPFGIAMREANVAGRLRRCHGQENPEHRQEAAQD
jgi:hypothetical protein